jgi:hypothetical protein
LTHIICRALICLFWEQGVCCAEEIEYEPDVGCLTFQDITQLELAQEGEDALEWEEEEDDGLGEDEEGPWEEEQDWEDEDLDF